MIINIVIHLLQNQVADMYTTEYGEGAVSILQIKKKRRHVYFENHHLKSRLLPRLEH